MRSYPPVSRSAFPPTSAPATVARAWGPKPCAWPGEALAARGVDVADRGNLAGPSNPWLPPRDGYRHLDEVVAWNRLAMDAIHAELQQGRLPIMLGGDHCLGIGSITAVARHCRETGKQLRVLWLDAHADFNTHEVTPSGNIHGMPVACSVRHRPGRVDRARRQHAGDLAFAGAPDRHPFGRRGREAAGQEHRLDVYDMRYIDEVGMKRAMEQALHGVDEDTHIHVSFDVDFLDPSIAPGVGTTVPGGPNYREAQLVMEMIADSGRMGSLDIVELNPALDHRNGTARLAVDLVESLFGKSTLMRD